MNKILNFERILCPVAQSHESDHQDINLRHALGSFVGLLRSAAYRMNGGWLPMLREGSKEMDADRPLYLDRRPKRRSFGM